MKRFFKLFALFALGAGCGMSCAQTVQRQEQASIKKAVDDYLRVQTAGLPGTVSYSVGSIDNRVVLAACATPEVFLPSGSRLWGATSVGVRCAGAAPWSIYLNVDIKVVGEYVVTARPLTQGRALAPADVAVQSGDLTQLPAGILTDPQLAVGKTLTAALAAGQPLRQEFLRSPLVIQQGQNVKVQSSGQGFLVTADGKSLSNATAGQVAQVRISTGHTVSGIARPGGIVEISN
jgi:flagella basal body P-ring formation protein FlgA